MNEQITASLPILFFLGEQQAANGRVDEKQIRQTDRKTVTKQSAGGGFG